MNKLRHIHFMGIAGSGMSAVAAIAAFQGYQISGCDLNPDSEYLKDLRKEVKFRFYQGHDTHHLRNVDILTITPAVTSLDPDNPEIAEARKRKIQILTWQEFMGRYLHQGKFVICVAGTHGKSTTTAMIGLILERAGFDPTVEVGAIVPQWRRNFRVGKGKYFVCEADEFNDNFLNYHPDVAVITNIEFDHPEYFKNLASVKKSFNKFVKNLKPGGLLIRDSKLPKDLKLQIPGEFNRQNAALAWRVTSHLGIGSEIIHQTLASFKGIGRRFDLKGEYQGAKIYDDYAHHPTAIKATIEAARQKFPRQKIWLIFQPHMFSRTKALFSDFVKVFQEIKADRVIVTDIFPSREKDTGLVSSQDLVQVIARKNVEYLGQIEAVAQFLKKNLKRDEVVINMGAGDIYSLSQILLHK